MFYLTNAAFDATDLREQAFLALVKDEEIFFSTPGRRRCNLCNRTHTKNVKCFEYYFYCLIYNVC